MLQIFYKEKPIIISDNKTDLKNSLMIDLELLGNIDLVKLLKKNNIRSIGILSDNEASVVSAFKNKFPEVTAAGGKVINQNSEILFIYRNKKWDLPKGKAEKNERVTIRVFSFIEKRALSSYDKPYEIFSSSKKDFISSCTSTHVKHFSI